MSPRLVRTLHRGLGLSLALLASLPSVAHAPLGDRKEALRGERHEGPEHRRTRYSASLRLGDQVPRDLAWRKEVDLLLPAPEARSRPRPIAFLGFGLPEDYGNVEIAGHVVAFLREVPALPALQGKDRSLEARLEALEKRDVEAVILLEKGPLGPFRHGRLPRLGIPIFRMGVGTLAEACPDLPGRVEALLATGAPQSRSYAYAPWSTFAFDVEPPRGQRIPARERREEEDDD